MRREFVLILLTLAFFTYLVSSHQVTSSPPILEVDPNQSYQYVINVNNTDVGQNANVTYVNITIPSSFIFVSGSNGTTATGNFTNTTTVLSWGNYSSTGYLINGSDTRTFQFNAIALNLGNYNLTITVVNGTGSYNHNISVAIADLEDPEISYASGTPSNNEVLSQTYIHVNVSATDNIDVDRITIFLYNSTRGLINSYSNQTDGLSVNFTGLSNGDYYINATANDTSGNSASTSTRRITLNTSSGSGSSPTPTNQTCNVNWTCTDWSSCVDNNQIRTCIDAGNCNTTSGKPLDSQTCGSVCTPNWDCTDWSECDESGFQTRTCTDLEECGVSKPAETLSCPEQEAQKNGNSRTMMIAVGGVVGVILILIIIGYFFLMKGMEPGHNTGHGNNGKGFPPRGMPPPPPSMPPSQQRIKGPLFHPPPPLNRGPPRGMPPHARSGQIPPKRL